MIFQWRETPAEAVNQYHNEGELLLFKVWKLHIRILTGFLVYLSPDIYFMPLIKQSRYTALLKVWVVFRQSSTQNPDMS